ncbi:unnamed protein product [Linum trigynum]|uniref:Uncharacterized protein n=1 Tax=Linum trigynum TaxID=586398 RepID=A0AAV2F7Y5_9ROSI
MVESPRIRWRQRIATTVIRSCKSRRVARKEKTWGFCSIPPKPKEELGVFGQGWERLANVFKATETFKKHVAKQAKDYQGNKPAKEETPAQADDSMNLKMWAFLSIWNLISETFN